MRGSHWQRFFKKKNNSLPRAPGDGPRQRLRPRRRRRDGCFSLPSAGPALSKGFAECPIKGLRQRPSSPTQNSPRALCRGLMGLCRGPQALGKEAASSSVLHVRISVKLLRSNQVLDLVKACTHMLVWCGTDRYFAQAKKMAVTK